MAILSWTKTVNAGGQVIYTASTGRRGTTFIANGNNTGPNRWNITLLTPDGERLEDYASNDTLKESKAWSEDYAARLNAIR